MADAKPAVERLSEDESLRGDLSDVGFGPLLDWAVAAVKDFAPKAADADALDAYTSRVRGVVQSAVQAAQDSQLDDPDGLLDYDPAGKDKVLAALKAIKFGDDPDQNAVQLAAALQTGLAPAPGAAPKAEAAPAQEAAQTTPSEVASGAEAAQPPPVVSNVPAPAATAASTPQPETVQTAEATQAAASGAKHEVAQEAQPEPAQPVKKNEEGASAGPPPPPNQNLNLEPPAAPAPSSAGPGAFLANVRSRVGQAYNSAWGVFKGLSKRRSG